VERHPASQLELREFQSQLALARSLDVRIVDLLRTVPLRPRPWRCCAPRSRRSAFYDADEKDNSHDANVRKSYNLTAQTAMIVAIYDRLRKGKEVVPPDRSLNHAANFLWNAQRRQAL